MANIQFIAVGAEGSHDLGERSYPWCRRATPEEEAAFRQALMLVRTDPPMQDFFIDHTGRPYWLWAMDLGHPDIPPKVAERALKYKRVTYLID